MGMLKNFLNLIRGLYYGKQFCFIYPDVSIGKNVTIFPGEAEIVDKLLPEDEDENS